MTAGVAVVATTFFVWLALSHRLEEAYPPFSLSDISNLPLNAWNVGDDLAATATMLFAFYLFSLTSSLRDYVTTEEVPWNYAPLLAGWLAF